MTQEVIQNVTRAGYRIVSVISDNNVVNRKMFMELSGTGRLVPYIQNPINVDERIYILFDTVHLLKCIRNNWINDVEKSFIFPDFSDNTVILNAVFSDLINIYHMEKESILKDGYKLTWKSLFPNNIDRQNVKLALKVFDRTTIAALEVLGPHTSKLQHWEGTAQFISIVLKFWNIVNVKNTTKGLHKLLEDATVISSIKDDRLNWLDRFSSWLKLWNTKTEKQGHLSKETSTALIHTVDTLVLLVKYLLHHHKLQFVLLGKFQTDNLEARFGLYRMLSGSNYLVSVNEVLQSEKKLKVHSLLKLYTNSHGIIRIKDFFMEFSEPSSGKCDEEFVKEFPYDNVSTKAKNEDLASLLYTAGYVARKASSQTDCNECKELFGNKGNTMDLDPIHFQYINHLDRGGLIYPSNLLFMVLQVAYNIFNMCVSGNIENKFLIVEHQKRTLFAITDHFITTNEQFECVYYACEKCNSSYITLQLKALGYFYNVCLNNYSKQKSDKAGNTKNKNKLAKLN